MSHKALGAGSASHMAGSQQMFPESGCQGVSVRSERVKAPRPSEYVCADRLGETCSDAYGDERVKIGHRCLISKTRTFLGIYIY